jgi:hypothetical protein
MIVIGDIKGRFDQQITLQQNIETAKSKEE